MSLMLFSPAKINLFFRVLHKRKDGYHDIASVVQCVDFGDTLTVSLTEGEESFSCLETTLSWDSSNLIYKAVQLFREKTGLHFQVAVHLEKRIPMQAGLGGGSSNAATMLYALNHLLNTGVSDQELAKWGTALGADVPCFFGLGRVFCEGIGEKLTRVSSEQEEYWIAKPINLALATPQVYAHCTPRSGEIFAHHKTLENDLEEAAFKMLPSLEQFKKQCLSLGFTSATMTGSGTAFVCRGDVFHPYLPQTLFVKTRSISRQVGCWYSHP